MSNNHDNTNTNSNLFNDMSNSDILFINILNTMYNDNLRMIHHFMDQNSEITFQLIDILNSRRRQNIPLNNSNSNRNYTTNRTNNTYNRNRNNYSSVAENNNASQRRVYIDNIPYYVDNLQLFSLPITTGTTIGTTTGTTNGTTTGTTNGSSSRNLSNHFSRILNSFLEPVNITPTQTQIENATRNIVYGDILEPINNSCPISLETFTDTSNVTMIRHCRHIFNTTNLMSWFGSNCKCPVCRYDIRNYDPNNSTTNNTVNDNNEDNEVNEEELEYEQNNNNNNNNSSTSSSNNIRQNQETRETPNRINRNNNNNNNNSIEALFFEIIGDLSNNNIEYSYDNTSMLFNSLFPPTRRRETRR